MGQQRHHNVQNDDCVAWNRGPGQPGTDPDQEGHQSQPHQQLFGDSTVERGQKPLPGRWLKSRRVAACRREPRPEHPQVEDHDGRTDQHSQRGRGQELRPSAASS
jgi:hypothetical protein